MSDSRLLGQQALADIAAEADLQESAAKARYERMVSVCSQLRAVRTEDDARTVLKLLDKIVADRAPGATEP